MKKVEEHCYCDICGKEVAKSYQTLAYRTRSDYYTNVKYSSLRIEQVSIDLCEECALKATNIHSIGVFSSKYEIRKGEK